jgi:hypothetical protein
VLGDRYDTFVLPVSIATGETSAPSSAVVLLALAALSGALIAWRFSRMRLTKLC